MFFLIFVFLKTKMPVESDFVRVIVKYEVEMAKFGGSGREGALKAYTSFSDDTIDSDTCRGGLFIYNK